MTGRRKPSFYANETTEEYGIRVNEDRRDDPELQEAVRRVLMARRGAILELQPHIEAMMEIVQALPYDYVTEDVGVRIDHRVTDSVKRLFAAFHGWKGGTYAPPGDTYVRNVAGFELGREIARRELS